MSNSSSLFLVSIRKTTYNENSSTVLYFSPQGRGNVPFGSGAREMAAILDTALLQALLLTGQASAALELVKGVNYCDVKICKEILQKNNHYTALLELYKGNSMHHEALKLLHQLVEESRSTEKPAELTQTFKPESMIEYLKVRYLIDLMSLVLDVIISGFLILYVEIHR